MTLARNLLQRLNGSKIGILLVIITLFASCELFKPVVDNNNNNNSGGTELDEVTSGRKVDVDGNVIEDDPVVDNNNTNGDKDGDGVMDRVDKCPDVAGPVRLEGCPEGDTNTGGNDTGSGGNDTGNTGGNSDGNGDPKGDDIDTTAVEDPIIDGNFKSSYKVAILMPFFAQEVSTATKMPGKSIKGMNFYEGSLMALQQLSAEGVNLDVEVFDSRRSTGVIQGLVDNYTLSEMDLIIGPAASSNVKIVAEQVAKKEEVPMVSLNLNSKIASENPFFIQASPYFASHAEATVAYVKKKYPTTNVVLVVPNGGKEMSRLTYYHAANKGVRYNEFYAEKTGSTYKFDGLTDILSAGDTTIVISPVSNEVFASGLMRTVNSTRGSKPVIVFGMPSWMTYQNLSVGMLEGCNLHVTNGSFVDRDNEQVKSFKQSFFNEYGAAPTVEAYKGYDLTLYFGRMLNQYGTSFINNLDEADETLLQSSFNFERVFESDSGSGMDEDYKIRFHENKYVHILRYQNYRYLLMNNPNSIFSD